MNVLIRFTLKQEAKAITLLLRHSPGMILPGRIYVVKDTLVELLRANRVRFTEISREAEATDLNQLADEELLKRSSREAKRNGISVASAEKAIKRRRKSAP